MGCCAVKRTSAGNSRNNICGCYICRRGKTCVGWSTTIELQMIEPRIGNLVRLHDLRSCKCCLFRIRRCLIAKPIRHKINCSSPFSTWIREDCGMEKQECLPSLCTNACGFFGSPSWDGMCSKCFKTMTQSSTPQTLPVTALEQVRPETSPAELSQPEQDPPQKENVDGIVATTSNVPTAAKILNNETDAKSIDKPSDEKANNSNEQAAADPSPASQDETQTMVTAKRPRMSHPLSGGKVSERMDNTDSSRSASDDSRPGSASQKSVNRCKECNRKVGLTGYNCRCGHLFCGMHRYSDVHQCQFDYRTMGTEEIRKNNPVVKGDKVQKL